MDIDQIISLIITFIGFVIIYLIMSTEEQKTIVIDDFEIENNTRRDKISEDIFKMKHAICALNRRMQILEEQAQKKNKKSDYEYIILASKNINRLCGGVFAEVNESQMDCEDKTSP